MLEERVDRYGLEILSVADVLGVGVLKGGVLGSFKVGTREDPCDALPIFCW